MVNKREITLEVIKQQIQIWEDYYNMEGVYRDDTICLINDETAIFNPFVSPCMRFAVDSVAEYGQQAYEGWLRDIKVFIAKNGVG